MKIDYKWQNWYDASIEIDLKCDKIECLKNNIFELSESDNLIIELSQKIISINIKLSEVIRKLALEFPEPKKIKKTFLPIKTTQELDSIEWNDSELVIDETLNSLLFLYY